MAKKEEYTYVCEVTFSVCWNHEISGEVGEMVEKLKLPYAHAWGRSYVEFFFDDIEEFYAKHKSIIAMMEKLIGELITTVKVKDRLLKSIVKKEEVVK